MGKRDTAITAVIVVEPIKKPYIKSIPEKVFFSCNDHKHNGVKDKIIHIHPKYNFYHMIHS